MPKSSSSPQLQRSKRERNENMELNEQTERDATWLTRRARQHCRRWRARAPQRQCAAPARRATTDARRSTAHIREIDSAVCRTAPSPQRSSVGADRSASLASRTCWRRPVDQRILWQKENETIAVDSHPSIHPQIILASHLHTREPKRQWLALPIDAPTNSTRRRASQCRAT